MNSDAEEWSNTENNLREKLLIAESRIVSLECLVAQLRGQPLSKRRHQSRISNTAEKKAIHEMTCGRCFFCSMEIALNEMSVDHLIPASKGGSSRLTNLVPACFACNGKKGNTMPSAAQVERAYGLFLLASKKREPVKRESNDLRVPLRFPTLHTAQEK